MELAVKAIVPYEDAVKQNSDQVLAEERGRATDAGSDLLTQSFRINIRFGQNHSITEAHDAFATVYRTRRLLVKSLEGKPQAANQELAENKPIASAAAAFLAACRDWFQEEA
jgi:hypothetical protein